MGSSCSGAILILLHLVLERFLAVIFHVLSCEPPGTGAVSFCALPSSIATAIHICFLPGSVTVLRYDLNNSRAVPSCART
jgi:hypothetical protein